MESEVYRKSKPDACRLTVVLTGIPFGHTHKDIYSLLIQKRMNRTYHLHITNTTVFFYYELSDNASFDTLFGCFSRISYILRQPLVYITFERRHLIDYNEDFIFIILLHLLPMCIGWCWRCDIDHRGWLCRLNDTVIIILLTITELVNALMGFLFVLFYYSSAFVSFTLLVCRNKIGRLVLCFFCHSCGRHFLNIVL